MNTTEEGAGSSRHPRRSDRLRRLQPQPHAQTSVEGSILGRSRSPRLNPEARASETAGVILRRSPPADVPEAQANEMAGVMRRRSPPAEVPEAEDGARVKRRCLNLLELDHVSLWEVLVRLPYEPIDLVKTSFACKVFRQVMTDPFFRASFCARNGEPPLLGAFSAHPAHPCFFTQIPQDSVQMINLRHYNTMTEFELLDCRHGLILVLVSSSMVLVEDPISKQRLKLTVPTQFTGRNFKGAVVCADGDQSHGKALQARPLKVVLSLCQYYSVIMCVYSSPDGKWGDVFSSNTPYKYIVQRAVQIDRRLFFLANENDVIVINMDEESLSIIPGPPISTVGAPRETCCLHATPVGTLAFATLSYPDLNIWRKNTEVGGWTFWGNVQMKDFDPELPEYELTYGGWNGRMIGNNKKAGSLLVQYMDTIYELDYWGELSKELCEQRQKTENFQLFRSFYTPVAEEVRVHGQSNVTLPPMAWQANTLPPRMFEVTYKKRCCKFKCTGTCVYGPAP